SLFLDLAAGCLDCCTGTLGSRQALDGDRFGHIAGQDDLGTHILAADDVGIFQRLQIDDINIQLVQLAGADFGGHLRNARDEAELRQTAVQRLLTTLEAGSDGTAGAGGQTLVAAAGSLAQAAADTTTDAQLGWAGSGRGTQIIQFHVLTLNPHHVGDLIDHPTNSRSIFDFNGMTDTTQAQTLDAGLVARQTTDHALVLGDFDFCISHVSLPHDVFNGLATLGRHGIGRLHGLQTLVGSLNDVDRVGGTVTFGQYVMDASGFQNGAHCATGDYTGTFGGWHHEHLGGAMCSPQGVLNSGAIQIHLDHVTTCGFHGLLDSSRHFTRLATTEAHATIAVANYCQRCEGKDPTALNYFGDAVNLNQFLDVTFVTLLIEISHSSTLRIPAR